jgi:hypothetical protein
VYISDFLASSEKDTSDERTADPWSSYTGSWAVSQGVPLMYRDLSRPVLSTSGSDSKVQEMSRDDQDIQDMAAVPSFGTSSWGGTASGRRDDFARPRSLGMLV